MGKWGKCNSYCGYCSGISINQTDLRSQRTGCPACSGRLGEFRENDYDTLPIIQILDNNMNIIHTYPTFDPTELVTIRKDISRVLLNFKI